MDTPETPSNVTPFKRPSASTPELDTLEAQTLIVSVADHISATLPGVGFALIVFPTNGESKDAACISNCRDLDVSELLSAVASKMLDENLSFIPKGRKNTAETNNAGIDNDGGKVPS